MIPDPATFLENIRLLTDAEWRETVAEFHILDGPYDLSLGFIQGGLTRPGRNEDPSTTRSRWDAESRIGKLQQEAKELLDARAMMTKPELVDANTLVQGAILAVGAWPYVENLPSGRVHLRVLLQPFEKVPIVHNVLVGQLREPDELKLYKTTPIRDLLTAITISIAVTTVLSGPIKEALHNLSEPSQCGAALGRFGCNLKIAFSPWFFVCYMLWILFGYTYGIVGLYERIHRNLSQYRRLKVKRRFALAWVGGAAFVVHILSLTIGVHLPPPAAQPILMGLGGALMLAGLFCLVLGRAHLDAQWGPHIYWYTRFEDEELRKRGIFEYERHPVYVGQFLLALGTAIFLMNPILSFFPILTFWYGRERAREEDRDLHDRFRQSWVELSRKNSIFSLF